MKEDFVTPKQAIKLKELGFDYDCNHYYYNNAIVEDNGWAYSNYHDFNSNTEALIGEYDLDKICSAPTLAQVQKWLREKEIEVGVFGDFDEELPNGKWVWLMRKFNTLLYDTVFTEANVNYDTYEEALSAGIDSALEILKEENK